MMMSMVSSWRQRMVLWPCVVWVAGDVWDVQGEGEGEGVGLSCVTIPSCLVSDGEVLQASRSSCC